jgi:hypothetical protein
MGKWQWANIPKYFKDRVGLNLILGVAGLHTFTSVKLIDGRGIVLTP